MTTTVAEASRDFDRFCDAAVRGETVIITRTGGEDVALVPASDLVAMSETAHLLRSPANAIRLFTVLERLGMKTVTPK
jgi:antitoxin YefM